MSNTTPLALLTLGAVSFLACGGEPPRTEAPPPTATAEAKAPPAAAASTGSGSISGKIAFEGTVPAAQKVKLTADPKCAAMHKEGLERQTVKVKDGGLADVLVYVKTGVSGSYPPPAEPALLDQKGCDYTPHMTVLVAGQPLKIRNSDDTLHNIHPRPTINQEFNFGQPRQGAENTKLMDKPEVMIPVGCDVHPWMRAYISVLSHPFFAVTKEDGTFEIKGLPAGEYEVEAAHGKLKTMTGKISVKDGEAARLDLTFKG
jgi:hypothetical protein